MNTIGHYVNGQHLTGTSNRFSDVYNQPQVKSLPNYVMLRPLKLKQQSPQHLLPSPLGQPRPPYAVRALCLNLKPYSMNTPMI